MRDTEILFREIPHQQILGPSCTFSVCVLLEQILLHLLKLCDIWYTDVFVALEFHELLAVVRHLNLDNSAL